MSAEEVREMKRRLHDLTTVRTDAVRRRMWWNIAVCPLFLPLMLTPVSNFPIYWFLWRAWNNRRAWQGGTALRHLILLTDDGDDDAANKLNAEDQDDAWIDRSKECTRIVRGESSVVVDDDNDNNAMCCRVRSSVSAASSSCSLGGPAVLFVPCHVLDTADKKLLVSEQKSHLRRRESKRVTTTTTVNAGKEEQEQEQQVSPPGEESFKPEAVREVENMLGARGMTELVRRYHRLASTEG